MHTSHYHLVEKNFKGLIMMHYVFRILLGCLHLRPPSLLLKINFSPPSFLLLPSFTVDLYQKPLLSLFPAVADPLPSPIQCSNLEEKEREGESSNPSRSNYHATHCTVLCVLLQCGHPSCPAYIGSDTYCPYILRNLLRTREGEERRRTYPYRILYVDVCSTSKKEGGGEDPLSGTYDHPFSPFSPSISISISMWPHPDQAIRFRQSMKLTFQWPSKTS